MAVICLRRRSESYCNDSLPTIKNKGSKCGSWTWIILADSENGAPSIRTRSKALQPEVTSHQLLSSWSSQASSHHLLSSSSSQAPSHCYSHQRFWSVSERQVWGSDDLVDGISGLSGPYHQLRPCSLWVHLDGNQNIGPLPLPPSALFLSFIISGEISQSWRGKAFGVCPRWQTWWSEIVP